MGPLGRRGWDPSKNKTQGGPAVGMESFRPLHTVQQENPVLVFPEGEGCSDLLLPLAAHREVLQPLPCVFLGPVIQHCPD